MQIKVPLAVAMFVLASVPAVGGSSTDASLVEGHTTYAEIVLGDDGVATLDIIGDVRCHVEVLGVHVDVPPSVDRVGVDCGSGLSVYVTHAGAPDPRTQLLEPTGDLAQAAGPQGTTWTATEFTYHGPDGGTHTAWTVPVDAPRVDPATGDTYRFMAPVPADAVPDGGELRLRLGPHP